jgi:molybdate transport system ATP-binding protein
MRIHVEIRHGFGDFALDVGLDLEGGLTALLGPSGAGKTRTLDVIAGFLKPAHAVVSVGDDLLADTARGIWVPPHRRRIGYVFQDARLFPHLSVRHNLAFGRWFNGARGAGHPSADEVIALLDLQPLLARKPGRLSGGERRRVALGRALLSNPRLLLLDEPLGSLDVPKRQEILPYLDRLIAEFRLPMIYVTHDWDEVRGRARQIVLIENGRTKTADAPDETGNGRPREIGG